MSFSSWFKSDENKNTVDPNEIRTKMLKARQNASLRLTKQLENTKDCQEELQHQILSKLSSAVDTYNGNTQSLHSLDMRHPKCKSVVRLSPALKTQLNEFSTKQSNKFMNVSVSFQDQKSTNGLWGTLKVSMAEPETLEDCHTCGAKPEYQTKLFD